MRDYDETFKEMKKENFNLKLRIFFLEVSFATDKNCSQFRRLIVNLVSHFLNCTISSTYSFTPCCKLKCHETWWDWM